MYIYTYMHIHAYIHAYMYTHIYRCNLIHSCIIYVFIPEPSFPKAGCCKSDFSRYTPRKAEVRGR